MNPEGVSGPFQLNSWNSTEIVQHELIDKLILRNTLHHTVPLFSESPYNSKYGYFGFLICFWKRRLLFNIRLLYFQWLYYVIDCKNGASSADSRTAVKYYLAFLWRCALDVRVYFCCKGGVHYVSLLLDLLIWAVVMLNIFN